MFAPVLLSLVFTTHFPLTRGNPEYAVSPAAPLAVYGVNGGVLYRSDDGGASFAKRGNVIGPSVAVDPSNAEIVYDVLGGRRSDDGGASWTPRAFAGALLRVDPLNEDSVWAADGLSKLWHSADGGATWSLAAQFAGPIANVALDGDGSHVHVALSRDVTPGEWDAAIRGERRRASGK